MSSRIYLLVTLAFYAVGALSVLVHAVTRRRLLDRWNVTASLIGFAAHTAALSQRWNEAGHFPVVGFHDAASFLAWTTVLAFLATYLQTREEVLGLAVHPTSFVLVLLAVLSPVQDREDPILKSLFLPIHTTLALFGYGALFVAFTMGVLYIIQERELRARSPRAFYYLIPSLERCDTIGGHTVLVGFAFLTLAIATGILWNLSRGPIWTSSPKEWSATAAWFIYVALLVARHRSGWGGRRAAVLGIAGFSVVVFIFFFLALVRTLGGVP